MKYVDEFRNKKAVDWVSRRIFEIMPAVKVKIMEVCGTHTQSFHRFSLEKLIPDTLDLIAGPGCPVCVSDQDYIDIAVDFSNDKDNIILSFGDMLRVPGAESSLEIQRAQGKDVRIVYSAWDSLEIAKKNPGRKVIFLAVGFETTAPTLALTLQEAQRERLYNLLFFTALKLIPPAMGALVSDPKVNIDGFLCPGHVSAIIGSRPYEFIAKEYGIPCCIAGFEPFDILEGIYFLLYQIITNKACVKNQYARVVKREGNLEAKSIIKKVFKVSSAVWRGIGSIPQSGLKLREEFADFDAEKIITVKHKVSGKTKKASCRCADILKGIIKPVECPLFRKRCTPHNPYGPCMVSSEGACNAYYQYK